MKPATPAATPPDDPGQAAAAPQARFETIRQSRAFEDIAQQIRGELAQGRLKVGSRLPAERVLAEQFGVSRNTLREALRSLENSGLIRLEKGSRGGAFVSERSGGSLSGGMMDMFQLGDVSPTQLTQARIWLESLIVREACARATPADIAALELNIAETEEAFKQGDFPARAKKNLEFHRILARMTGNPIMVAVMNAVLDVLREFIAQVGSYQNSFVLTSRRRFMKHFVARDVEASVAEMETSLKRLEQRYLSHLADKGTP